MNIGEIEKKFTEEVARQLLIYIDPDKYINSYLSERPDIQSKKSNLGVEVTSSLKEEVHRKLAVSNRIMKKSKLDTRDERQIEKNDLKINKLIGRNIPSFTTWGDTNNLIDAYKDKLISMEKEGYTIYDENNLFINTKMPDEEELTKFIEYIKENRMSDENLDFNNIYIYIDTKPEKLLSINKQT